MLNEHYIPLVVHPGILKAMDTINKQHPHKSSQEQYLIAVEWWSRKKIEEIHKAYIKAEETAQRLQQAIWERDFVGPPSPSPSYLKLQTFIGPPEPEGLMPRKKCTLDDLFD